MSDTVARLEKRAQQAEAAIAWLSSQLASLQQAAQSAELLRLRDENTQLQQQVAHWKHVLCQAEQRNGVTQVQLPDSRPNVPAPQPISVPANTQKAAPVAVEPNTAVASPQEQPQKKKEKKSKPAKPAGDVTAAAGGAADEPVDIGLLDLRVGKIISAEKHPDADALYVEQVDVGEAQPRTVVSGLVRFVPVEQMQDRMAVLLCNLKPAKMRGVTSQAMVMCASTPDKVEILSPPAGAQPGQPVTCAGFVSRCSAQLNPKKKVFERVAPELRTDAEMCATFRGVRWQVGELGAVTAQTLADVQIK